jgi:membrane-bound metal-dependent hydrolase YbcI (DUF457 family)
MPFTPYHVGPGIAVKSVFQKKFSLLVFAWAQVVMDLQPLVVVLTGHGRTHGVTHTLIGAVVLGGVAGLSGKYLVEWLLSWRRKNTREKLGWGVVLFSAWLGTFSHVLIDGLIYPDMDLFWPFMTGNPLRIGVTPREMIWFCIFSGVLGALVWGVVALVRKRREGKGN